MGMGGEEGRVAQVPFPITEARGTEAAKYYLGGKYRNWKTGDSHPRPDLGRSAEPVFPQQNTPQERSWDQLDIFG